MTKHVGLMQQHIRNKTRTVTRGGFKKPTKDRITEAAMERFSLKKLFQNLKKNSERSLKMLVKSLKNTCEAANFWLSCTLLA